jgi:hypothetical protein
MGTFVLNLDWSLIFFYGTVSSDRLAGYKLNEIEYSYHGSVRGQALDYVLISLDLHCTRGARFTLCSWALVMCQGPFSNEERVEASTMAC